MTVIRYATRDDIDRIVEMAHRFYPESGYASIAPMKDENVAGLAIITMDTGVMLVAERDGELIGMASLHLDPWMFNPDALVAHELVYWIEPEHRGGMLAVRMLKAIEQACREKGAVAIRMATLAGSPESAGALYERAGFPLTERYYTKRL